MNVKEMKELKKFIRQTIKELNLNNEVTIRNQKIKQLIDISTNSEKAKLPKWYFNI